jgi:hypothetical protein
VELVVTLSDEQLEQLAARAAELLAERQESAAEPWLTVEQAAEHLAISTSQLYSLTSQRHHNGLPLTKEGSRNYYRASELDAWRRAEASMQGDAPVSARSDLGRSTWRS